MKLCTDCGHEMEYNWHTNQFECIRCEQVELLNADFHINYDYE